jgi:hypothetical protein
MKNILLIAIILIYCIQIKSQSLKLRVDSIKVEYLPWNSHYRFTITESDFLNIDRVKSGLKIKVISDSAAIKDFLNINLVRPKSISPIKNIDIRMYISVYASNYFTSVLIDKSKMYYKNSTEVYLYSSSLFDWIDKYVVSSK